MVPLAAESPPLDLRGILDSARTIAVVGASDEPWRPSFGVAAYLKRAGYRVLPVNPTIAGRELHGERVRAALTDLAEAVDIVNVFRRPEFVPEVAEAAIAIRAPVLWMQLGVRHDGAAARAEEAGLSVVADCCISVEHRRLLPWDLRSDLAIGRLDLYLARIDFWPDDWAASPFRAHVQTNSPNIDEPGGRA